MSVSTAPCSGIDGQQTRCAQDRSSSPCPEEPSTPRTEGATRLDFIDGFVEVQNTDGTPLFQFRASALLVSPALVRHLQSTQSTPSLQPWSPATPSTPSPASGVHRVGNTRDQRGAGIAPYSRPRGGSQLASPAAVASLSKGDPFLVTPAASMSGSSTQQTRSHMAGPPTSAGAFVPAEVADIRVSNVSIVKTPKPPNAGAVSRWRKTRPPHESDRRNMILALIGVYVETMGCILCDLRGGDFSHPDSMCPIPFNYADPGYLRFLQEVGFPGPPSCKYCWLPMVRHPFI